MDVLRIGDRVECFAFVDGSRRCRGTIVKVHDGPHRTYDFKADGIVDFLGSGYSRRFFRKLSLLELIAEAAQ